MAQGSRRFVQRSSRVSLPLQRILEFSLKRDGFRPSLCQRLRALSGQSYRPGRRADFSGGGWSVLRKFNASYHADCRLLSLRPPRTRCQFIDAIRRASYRHDFLSRAASCCQIGGLDHSLSAEPVAKCGWGQNSIGQCADEGPGDGLMETAAAEERGVRARGETVRSARANPQTWHLLPPLRSEVYTGDECGPCCSIYFDRDIGRPHGPAGSDLANHTVRPLERGEGSILNSKASVMGERCGDRRRWTEQPAQEVRGMDTLIEQRSAAGPGRIRPPTAREGRVAPVRMSMPDADERDAAKFAGPNDVPQRVVHRVETFGKNSA